MGSAPLSSATVAASLAIDWGFSDTSSIAGLRLAGAALAIYRL
jgi:hypothetical protein